MVSLLPVIRKTLRKSSAKTGALALPKAYLNVRLVLQMHSIHKAYARRRERHDDRLRPRAIPKETNVLQEITVGYAAGGKHDVAARRQFLRGVNLRGVLYTHGLHTLTLPIVAHHQTAENLPVQTAQSRRRQHTFRSAARSHDGVDSGASHRGRNSSREI